MPPSAPPESPCAIHGILEVLAGPWTMNILWVLSTGGPTRFGALRRKVEGISSRMLSERLHLLEQKGFIFRHCEPSVPPAVTYGITKRMKDIARVLDDLERLARKWKQADSSAGRRSRRVAHQMVHGRA